MMTKTIPEDFISLFDKKSFAHLATHTAKGGMQVNPIWCGYESDHVVINSAKGRAKDLNMRRNPEVTLCVSDPDDPYRYLEIRGVVREITEEGADEMIDRFAKRYMGVDSYPFRQADEVRVIYRIEPVSVFTQ